VQPTSRLTGPGGVLVRQREHEAGRCVEIAGGAAVIRLLGTIEEHPVAVHAETPLRLHGRRFGEIVRKGEDEARGVVDALEPRAVVMLRVAVGEEHAVAPRAEAPGGLHLGAVGDAMRQHELEPQPQVQFAGRAVVVRHVGRPSSPLHGSRPACRWRAANSGSESHGARAQSCRELMAATSLPTHRIRQANAPGASGARPKRVSLEWSPRRPLAVGRRYDGERRHEASCAVIRRAGLRVP
jgi:hypothetical protein